MERMGTAIEHLQSVGCCIFCGKRLRQRITLLHESPGFREVHNVDPINFHESFQIR